MQLGTILGTAFGFCLPPAILFAGMMVLDPGGRLYTIEPILSPARVPDAVQGDGVAASLRTEVSRLVNELRSDVAIRPNMPGDAVSQIRITGTDLTIETVRRFARAALGRRDVRITGELSEVDDRPRTVEPRCFGGGLDHRTAVKPRHGPNRLVLKDGERGLVFDCTGFYDDLVRMGGLAIFASTDPFSTATLLAKRDPQRNLGAAFLLAETARVDGERDAGGFSVAGLFCTSWPNYDVPRAHLTLGNLHLERGRLDEAEAAFVRANAAFAGVDCHGRDWYAAKDALALVTLSRAWGASEGPGRYLHVAHGREIAERALVLKPGFDGAMYRRAESFDIESRRRAEPDGSDVCKRLASLRSAMGGYRDLVAAHPRFEGGYTRLGGLVVQRLGVLRDRGEKPDAEDGCLGEVSAPAQETMDLLATGIFAYSRLSVIKPDKPYGERDFWPLLATIGFEQAFPIEGARTRCPEEDDDWSLLVESAVTHFSPTEEGETMDAARQASLDRSRAAHALFTRAEGGGPDKASRLRDLARALPEGEERRRVERAARDLAACGAKNPNAHASR